MPPQVPTKRWIHWRCPRCGDITSEVVRVGQHLREAPPVEETIELTCAACERRRRERVLNGVSEVPMSRHLYATLDALQNACAESVFARTRARPERHGGTGVCRAVTLDERRACDLIVAQSVLWFGDLQPPRTHKAFLRMQAEVRERAESAVCGVGLLVLIGEALFSWLVQAVLSWLWEWYRRTEEAAALICGMVAGMGRAPDLGPGPGLGRGQEPGGSP